MSVIAIKRRRVWNMFLDIVPVILLVIAVGGIAYWGVFTPIMNWHRGIYAGFHYGGAKRVAINSLVVQYGRDTAAKMKFAEPPVVNTHSNSLLVDGQIRVFHIVGPAGTKYCVTVWNPGYYWTGPNSTGIDIGGDTAIKKGCTF